MKKEALEVALSLGRFRALCEVILPEWQFASVTEVFYSFADQLLLDPEKSSAVVAPNQLQYRGLTMKAMTYLFRSLQLSRFISLKQDYLITIHDMPMQQKIRSVRNIFDEMRFVVQRACGVFDAKGLKYEADQLRIMCNEVILDLHSYDIPRAITNMAKTISAYV